MILAHTPVILLLFASSDEHIVRPTAKGIGLPYTYTAQYSFLFHGRQISFVVGLRTTDTPGKNKSAGGDLMSLEDTNVAVQKLMNII